MELRNAFDVPLPPAEAWNWLLDIERIATCLPGAELTDVVDAQTYKGKVGVRLGPVALSFVGQAKLEQIDDSAHTARMRATGADAKGRGSTTALIDFTLEPQDDGASTRVNILSNVTLTGSVAQYGRGAGMIQSVAAQLIGQFGECLRSRIVEAEAAKAASQAQAQKSAQSSAQTAAVQASAASAAAPAAAGQPSPVPEALHRDTAPAPQAAARPSTAAPAKPVSGFSLLFRALFDSLRRMFGGKPRS